MSKKFRQEEPVQTQQGNGRIVGERNGSGPVTKWDVELEDGETVVLPTNEIWKLREEMPELEAEDEVVEEDD